jgi:hypothetical protein
MVQPFRIASVMAQAEVFEHRRFIVRASEDSFDLRAPVVARGQIKSNRTPATPAILAVALSKRIQALRVLAAPEFPQSPMFGDDLAAHA